MIEQKEKYYLFPSSIFAEREPCLVDTILGSCVSVCLFDHKKKIGGINHYMLPYWNGEGLASPKYGNVAIERLIEKMIRNGSSNTDMIAKIFGGANQIKGTINVGVKNIQVARDLLFSNKINIVAEDVGGILGRKIWFDTYTGQVLMKYLSKTV